MFLKRRTLPSAIVLRYILKVKKDSGYSESFFVFYLFLKIRRVFAGKNNNCRFAGFYGLYDITYTINGKTETKQVWFGKKSPRNIKVDIK